MRKLFLLTLSLLFIFALNIANAQVVFNKEKTLLLDYSKNENLEIFINSWNISFYSNDSLSVKINNDIKNKKIYLEVIWEDYKTQGIIYIKMENKIETIWYKLNLNKTEVFDISKSIDLKRIQERPLSCESSAAADIISHLKDTKVDEYSVYNLMKKDMPVESVKSWDNNYWRNPNIWFVGYIDYYWDNKDIKPYQSKYTGYGVYEKPVAEVFEKFWLKTKIINKQNYNDDFSESQHLSFLLNNLKSWNMVQLWWDWCTDSEYEDWVYKSDTFSQIDADNNKTAKNYCSTFSRDRTLRWIYNDNWKLKIHKGLSWEHAFYLLWYEWNIYNPEKIIVWDTDTWYHKYDIKEWMRKWSMMDYRSLIVYKADWELAYKKD